MCIRDRINTGWTAGPYGIGHRMKIPHTRAMLNAALNGELDEVKYVKDKRFGFEIPLECPDVPNEVLLPNLTWSNQNDYDNTADKLANMFIANFSRYADGVKIEVANSGPQI